MTAFDSTSQRLPFGRDFSGSDRELAESAALQQEERQRKAHEARAKERDAAMEDHRRRFHDLLGPKKSAELRDAIRAERLALRNKLQPPHGLAREYAKEKRATQRRIRALMGKLGAPPERVARIRDRYIAARQQAVADAQSSATPGFHLASSLDRWTMLSRYNVHPFPSEIAPFDDPNDPHRWFLETPPWFGFLFRLASWGSSNFRADRQLVLDPSAGLVGNEVTLDCNSADNSDEAEVTAETQIAFGFQAPVSGHVEVLIDAQCVIGTHYAEVEDEFGLSSGSGEQENFLMMNVLHPDVPEPSLALMSSAWPYPPGFKLLALGDDYALPVRDREKLVRGQHYFAHLVSSGPVPAGQSVVVTVGTRSLHWGYVDDMEYHSRSHFEWLINAVQLRIAP